MLSEDSADSPAFTIRDLDTESTTENAQTCEFCHCSRTPLWRRGPHGKATLCNACGIRWSSKTKEAKATVDTQKYIVNDQEEQEVEEFYQLDCRTGEAVPFLSRNSYDPSWQEGEGEDSVLNAPLEDASGYSSFDEKSTMPLDQQQEYAEGDNPSDGQEVAEEGWEEEEDYDKFSHDVSGIDEEDSDDRAGPSAEDADDALHGLTKMEAGKENYYCKYCDTSWPYSHFRNAQQFGAHCSNCSRKRKVKDPQELTIRERNKRLRKAKKVTPMSHERRKQSRNYAEHYNVPHTSEGDDKDASLSSEEDYDSAISFLQGARRSGNNSDASSETDAGRRRAANTVHMKRKRKFDDFTESSSATEDKDSNTDTSATRSSSSSRSSTRSAVQASAKKKAKHSKEKPSKKKSSSANRKSVKTMTIITPDDEPDHASVVSDPNSLGGLLGAIERKLTAEKKKREMANLKQHVWSMRKEVGEQFDSGMEDLRFRSVAMVQELRVDTVSKLEALKIELASELSFREQRRKKRLNEMRIQMNALNRILESGKKERENGLLLSTFGGKFDTALKQLEELKVNLQKEFSSREQAMQQHFTEMRATCSLHLANIKQQMHEELNIREGRMQKELEDMKNKLHSVCSQIGAENYCPETPSSSMPSGIPSPEKFTTTTTTTTTTTIQTINTTAPLSLGLSLVGLARPLVSMPTNLKSANSGKATVSPSSSSTKASVQQSGGVSPFGFQEIKSATS